MDEARQTQTFMKWSNDYVMTVVKKSKSICINKNESILSDSKKKSILKKTNLLARLINLNGIQREILARKSFNCKQFRNKTDWKRVYCQKLFPITTPSLICLNSIHGFSSLLLLSLFLAKRKKTALSSFKRSKMIELLKCWKNVKFQEQFDIIHRHNVSKTIFAMALAIRHKIEGRTKTITITILISRNKFYRPKWYRFYVLFGQSLWSLNARHIYVRYKVGHLWASKKCADTVWPIRKSTKQNHKHLVECFFGYYWCFSMALVSIVCTYANRHLQH